MGHKGVSKRKLPKEKTKLLVISNRGSDTISGLIKSENTPGQLAVKARMKPFGKGGANPSSGSKERNRNH